MISITTRRQLRATGVAFAAALAATTAHTAIAAEGGLEEIVVQAQRRSENLQVIPVTVSALGKSELAAANITTTTEMAKLVPSLAINPNSQSVFVFMRGIGSNVSAIGAEASVAIYVDGVYYSRLTPGFMRLNNIDHIEVLKGPQGTLFGRNASGGLVNIITRSPEVGAPATLEGTIGYGNYNTMEASAYAAAGLGSRVAADIAVNYYKQADGFGKSFATGKDVEREKEFSIRSKWVFDVTDTTRVKLTGDYQTYTSDIGQGTQVQGFQQGHLDGSGPLPQRGFFDTNADYSNAGNGKAYGVSIRLEQDLDFATLAATSSFHHVKQYNPFDVDLSEQPFEKTHLYSIGQESLNELQLLSKQGSSFDWTFGLFYMDQLQKYVPADFDGTLFDGLFGPGGALRMVSKSRVRSLAPYGQVRFEILPKLKVTAGVRYTRDQLSGDGYQALYSSAIPVTVIPGTYLTGRDTTKSWSWKGGLDYQFTDDLFGYFTASRGFKGATYNLLPYSPAATKPEQLDAYEVGIKSEWLDRTLRVNSAAFYYDLKNPQVIVIPSPSVVEVQNAGAAQVKGAEIELEAAPSKQFTVRASATYLDAKYTDYPLAAFYDRLLTPPYGNNPPRTASANGKKLPYAPDLTFNLGGEYKFDLDSGGQLSIGANYSYSSKVYYQPDNALAQNAYGLLDAHITYELASAPVKLTLWGSNLTDEHYYNGFVEFGNPGGDIGFQGSPLKFGFKVTYSYDEKSR